MDNFATTPTDPAIPAGMVAEVDWSKPIEAVWDTGEVCPAKVLQLNAGANPGNDHWVYVEQRGKGAIGPWSKHVWVNEAGRGACWNLQIRNATPRASRVEPQGEICINDALRARLDPVADPEPVGAPVLYKRAALRRACTTPASPHVQDAERAAQLLRAAREVVADVYQADADDTGPWKAFIEATMLGNNDQCIEVRIALAALQHPTPVQKAEKP